jgi:hypothetical protein
MGRLIDEGELVKVLKERATNAVSWITIRLLYIRLSVSLIATVL